MCVNQPLVKKMENFFFVCAYSYAYTNVVYIQTMPCIFRRENKT